MSSFFTFTTPPFSVVAAGVIDANTLRVILSAVPNAFVPSNFSIPTTTVVSAVFDPNDSNSIILSLNPGLQPGNYSVTCSGLTSGAPPVAMTAPFNAAFSVLVGPSVVLSPNLAQPAINPSATTTLRAHIPPSMRGNVWTQLLATLGEEEQFAWDQAAAVYDQLFLVSAEDGYLDQRASEEGGYLRPELVGFTDDVFRDLVIQLSTRKLTLNAFLRVLEIYYGIDVVRAHIRTTTAETFNIPDGSQQVFNIDGMGPFTVLFHGSEFTDPTAVFAIEAAIALNRGFDLIGAKALALPFVDNQTGLASLTVYTESRGLRGSIESVSGPLSFPAGKQTIQSQARSAYVKALNGTVEVVLPATSIVVSRTPNEDAAYINGRQLIVIFAQIDEIEGLVTIETNLPHGVLVGEGFLIEGLQYPAESGAAFVLNGTFQAVTVPSPNTIVYRVPGSSSAPPAPAQVIDNFGDNVTDSFNNEIVT